MKKKSKSKKRGLQLRERDESKELVQAPHSFVIARGFACPYINDLVKDFRKVLEPFTAANLKEKKNNKIKDYISLAGVFHVSHLCIFNKASNQLSFKVVKTPRGPTLTFKVHQFTLARDVLTQYRKQFVNENIFKHSPLVIMNNFAGEGKHLKLMATTFQNMFPSINLATVSLHTIKRCLLFSYNPITKLVEVRHYSISVVASGLKKSVKKLVLGKIPNLSKCSDISDYILQTNNASDTEGEEDEASQVVLPQDLKSKGNMADNKSAVHLHEIGPRMTLQLMKIEDGVMTGEVLFNETVVKTEEEIERIKKMREKKKRLKEQRQKIQNENKKKNEAEAAKKKRRFDKDNKQELPEEPEVEPDDDVKYYREEVGENPDEELFKTDMNEGRKRTRLPKNMSYAAKKRKMGEEKGNKKFSKDRNEKRGSRKDDDDERKPRFKKGNKFDRKDKFSKNKKFDRNDRKGGKKPIKSGRVTKKRFSK